MPKLFNKFTNKQGLVVFGGEASRDYGIVVSEAPSFDKPARKRTVFNVPGRNGSVLFQEDAFDDVTRSYRAWIADYDKVDIVQAVNAFTGMLYSKKGYQRLEDSFEPDTFRLAYFNGGQDISNEMMQYGETTISFVCRPERFYKDGEKEIAIANGDSIHNYTNYASSPLIYIEGYGPVEISIQGQTITAELDDYIHIDCERMNAYRTPSENKNADISGVFPKILPGTNGIAITGTTTKVTIKPRYFTI